jgi:hypothetical protein
LDYYLTILQDPVLYKNTLVVLNPCLEMTEVLKLLMQVTPFSSFS